MTAEPLAGAFTDWGEIVVLKKADGSATHEVRGLYDEAGTDYTTERARVRSLNPQVTVPVLSTFTIEEGDFCELRGSNYEILDAISDGKIATLYLTQQ